MSIAESDDSPGMYFNVGGPVELRAPTMERAALYLDMALSQISNHAYAPATVFTLHVYQYNLEQGKREYLILILWSPHHLVLVLTNSSHRISLHSVWRAQPTALDQLG